MSFLLDGGIALEDWEKEVLEGVRVEELECGASPDCLSRVEGILAG